MSSTVPAATVAVIKGTTASLSTIKSIGDIEAFMNNSTEKILNAKFSEMIAEFRGNEGEDKKKDVKSMMSKTQRGFSLSQILAQSLQNGDKQMLEAALCVSSAQHTSVLQVSLTRLPLPMVIPLLEAITKRLTLKPRRAIHLLPWLKNLLLCHAGYLSTVPSASKMLAPLQQSIEERLATVTSMQKLSGRLELILEQGKLRSKAQAMMEEVCEEPLTVYDESEGDFEEEDDEFEDSEEVESELESESDKEMLMDDENEEEEDSDNENDDDDDDEDEDDDEDSEDEDEDSDNEDEKDFD